MLRALPSVLFVGSISFIGFGVRQMLHADPYFRVERVGVFPQGVLTPSEYQFLERQAAGHNLIEIDLKQVSEHLERNPKVKRAQVTREFPGALHVFLSVRLAFIQVQLKERGPYYLVADDQLILSAQETPRPDLVILQDVTSEKKTYAPGTLYQNQYLHRLSHILESLKADPVLSQENISQLSMDQLGHVTLILNDGIELKVGSEVSLSEGSQVVLGSLLKSEERNDILYLDLRYRDIIVKRKTRAGSRHAVGIQ